MTERDSRGLPISTHSPQAASGYRDGIDLLLSAWPTAGDMLEEAIAADPGFALAHAARARIDTFRGQFALARSRIARAVELSLRSGTERERSHVETLALLINGEPARALTSALAHLERWPLDVVIFSLPMGAFGLFAFSGIVDHDQKRVDLCERHARHFGDADWWFLTYRGWSHVENGEVRRGRDFAERGLELRSQNANAAHAVSHALHESGAGEAAEMLIADWLPAYPRQGMLHGHLAWHSALSALERGDFEKALAIYERDIQPAVSPGMPINVLTDCVSLIWRIQAYGHEVPAKLCEPVAAYGQSTFPRAGLAFVDAHMGLLDAAAGDVSSAHERIAALRVLVDAGKLAAGPIVPAICEAALAFVEQDYAATIRLLEPLAAEVSRIGGSGAQREMFEDTLLLALMRQGEAQKAQALLDRRLHRRPSSRDARWKEQLAT